MQNPEGEIEKIMNDVGFTDIKVSYKSVTYRYKDIEDFQGKNALLQNYQCRIKNIYTIIIIQGV